MGVVFTPKVFLYFLNLFLVYFINNSYLCPIVQLAQQWAAGGLSDKKDVFERLSLCSTNLANSEATADR